MLLSVLETMKQYIGTARKNNANPNHTLRGLNILITEAIEDSVRNTQDLKKKQEIRKELTDAEG